MHHGDSERLGCGDLRQGRVVSDAAARRDGVPVVLVRRPQLELLFAEDACRREAVVLRPHVLHALLVRHQVLVGTAPRSENQIWNEDQFGLGL